MTNIIELDPSCSTTRRVIKADLQQMAEVVEQSNKPEDKFETVLFLPEGENRQGEGGLRTKGYFKQTQDDKPLITVVTVVYNCEQFLEETIQSVINQTYDNVEYIIVDGGSTDRTLDIIRKYEHAIDYWVSEKDMGIYDAMNKGIRVALGNFIGFVNADDFLFENTLLQLGKASTAINYDYTVGSVKIVGIDGLPKQEMRVVEDFLKTKRFLYDMATPHQAFYINRNLAKKNGLFDLTYSLSADFDYVVRTIFHSNNYYHFSGCVGGYREGGASGSYKTFYENAKIIKKNGSGALKASIYFVKSASKIFIIKNFPSPIVRLMKLYFSSGRFVNIKSLKKNLSDE